MRRLRSLSLILSLALSMVAILPGAVLAAEFPRVSNTTTGGSVGHVFNHRTDHLPECIGKYDIQITVAYGKVTNSTIYIKTVTIYYWVKTPYAAGGAIYVWTDDRNHLTSNDTGTMYSAYFTSRTWNVYKTMPITKDTGPKIRKASFASDGEALSMFCYHEDTIMIIHS